MAKCAPKVISERATVETWNEKDQRIKVSEEEGSLFKVSMNSKVLASPEEVYNILVDPNCATIFRSVKALLMRKILEDDGHGKRKTEVVHQVVSRFLFLRIQFETRLYVWEDDKAKTVRFQLAKLGNMKKFEGSWHIRPFTQHTLDHLEEKSIRSEDLQPFNPLGLLNAWNADRKKAAVSLVTLEQSILPNGTVPSVMKGLLKSLCANQVKGLMEDLNKEIRRRRDARDKEVITQGTSKNAAPMASIMVRTSIWESAYPLLVHT